LRSHGFLKTVKYKQALVLEPKAVRIVVLAPHMDDEVIGCGGTLYKHFQKGGELTVVYMTDGRHGSSVVQNATGNERKILQRKLVEQRKQEAQLAMQTLGVRESFFLDVEETRLTSTKEVQQRLRQILEAKQPELVYLPFFWEENLDHRETSKILLDATSNRHFQFECCGYEVWTPLFSNCLVDISDVIDVKKTALQHYRSQLAGKDYVHTSLGLNAYRSSALSDNQGGFAEAFFFASLQEYRRLYQSYMACRS
jgi:LmbE family N-acetylglucosaminyl deacetylase